MDDWQKELEREMRFFRISDAVDKKDAMLIYGGAEIRRLEKCLKMVMCMLNCKVS